MRGRGRTRRHQNPVSQAPNTPEERHVGGVSGADESVYQSQVQPDPITDRIAATIASLLPNTDRDNSIERAMKLGAKFFMGTSNPADAELWMKTLESIFDVIECFEDKKLCIFVFLLKGGAADWWISFRSRYPDPSVITWTIFKEAFFETYYPPFYRDAKQNEFLRLYASALVAEERDRCRGFEQGLRAEIRPMVTAHGHQNFGLLVEAALRVETAIREGNNQGAHVTFRGGSSQSGASGERFKKSRKGFCPGATKSGNFKSKSGRSSSSQGSRHSQSFGQQSVGSHSFVQSPSQRIQGARQSEASDHRSFPQCQSCEKFHPGECLRGVGVCYQCGQMGHIRKDCPARSQQIGASQIVSPQPGIGMTRQNRDERAPSARSMGATQSNSAKGSASRQGAQAGRSRTQGKVFAMTQQEAEESPDMVV
ncbi:uncharacterized protein LOC111377365, partial [Olea europaea var. sylvestris]|uniref:uncharacterized protein LOC111377365 n=1 Tax=Olea europaea var. sylvestris TaxID=158386 RepID=UPI000C1D7AFB